MNANDKRKLVIRLEEIIGNKCYNGSVQNWGSNYERYCDGREFRYPITFIDDGEKQKARKVDPKMPIKKLRTGYYAFGANQLHINEALSEIVELLEKEYGLVPNPNDR